MRFLSGAVLFFVLIGSNLQAFDHAGREKDKAKDKNSLHNTSHLM